MGNKDILIYSFHSPSSNLSNERLNELFSENEGSIKSLFNSIINDIVPCEWQHKWIKMCCNYWESFQKHSYPVDFYGFYRRVVYLIFKHLGLSADDSAVLGVFIENTFANQTTK